MFLSQQELHFCHDLTRILQATELLEQLHQLIYYSSTKYCRLFVYSQWQLQKTRNAISCFEIQLCPCLSASCTYVPSPCHTLHLSVKQTCNTDISEEHFFILRLQTSRKNCKFNYFYYCAPSAGSNKITVWKKIICRTMLMSALTNTQKLDTENAPISSLKFLKIQRKRLLGVSKD